MSFVLAHQSETKRAEVVKASTLSRSSLTHHNNSLAMDSHDSIIRLQQTIDNQAVQKLVRSDVGLDDEKNGDKHFFGAPLTVPSFPSAPGVMVHHNLQVSQVSRSDR